MLHPWAPAFMTTAPPTDPGIPAANSSPASPRWEARRLRCGRLAPHSATTRQPSYRTRACPRPVFTTTPRTPRSYSHRTTASRCASVGGSTRMSAGPPIRKETWRDRGSPRRTPPGHSLSNSATSASRMGTPPPRGPLPQVRRQRLGDLPHVPRADGEHQVSRAHLVPEARDDVRKLGHELHLPPGRDSPDDEAGVHAGDGRLVGRVQVRDDDPVGRVEGPGKLAPHGPRPREAVRLEDGDDPPVGPAPAHPLQEGPDLGGVVGVVVRDEDPPDLAVHRKPPLHPPEVAEGRQG